MFNLVKKQKTLLIGLLVGFMGISGIGYANSNLVEQHKSNHLISKTNNLLALTKTQCETSLATEIKDSKCLENLSHLTTLIIAIEATQPSNDKELTDIIKEVELIGEHVYEKLMQNLSTQHLVLKNYS